VSFWETNRHHFINAAVSLAVLVAAWLIYWLVRKAINRFSEVDPGAETRFRMIERLLAIALFLIAVGLVFWIMDVTAFKRVAVGIFASAGVVGVALGFAAQTTMANLVAGVIIAFAQPIRLGDNVTIDDEYGTVESIGLFYTCLRTWDNRRLVLPNKVLSDQPIRNYSLVDSRMPAIVVLRLDYAADVDSVKALLLAEARAHPLLVGDPAPSVQIIDADDTGVTARLSAWTAEQANAWTLAVEVREAVVKKLAASAVPVKIRWTQIVSQPRTP
jgi:small conductance mechanosensitive channel